MISSTGFQVFAYRYMDTEKYFVKEMHVFKDLDELLAVLRAEETKINAGFSKYPSTAFSV